MIVYANDLRVGDVILPWNATVVKVEVEYREGHRYVIAWNTRGRLTYRADAMVEVAE